MPNDTLREEIEDIRRSALAYIGSNKPNEQQRRQNLIDLRNAESRLSSDIEERNTTFVAELERKQAAAIEAARNTVHQGETYQRAFQEQKANHLEFEGLRLCNKGAGYPKNISPVLYWLPLVLIGVAEWYVNYSTFAAMFIPVFAIAATLIVAAVFAGASHLHGAYLKQISEVLHPSVEYRNVLGRKIMLIIVTVLLVLAFSTVVWLRWLVIAGQLGTDSGTEPGTFGGASSAMIWSKVGPTIVVNLLIWGLGTLYSWSLHEKIPGLRESYRKYRRTSAVKERKLRPFRSEERRLKAVYDREREKNNVVIKEYKALLGDVQSTIDRLQEAEPVLRTAR